MLDKNCVNDFISLRHKTIKLMFVMQRHLYNMPWKFNDMLSELVAMLWCILCKNQQEWILSQILYLLLLLTKNSSTRTNGFCSPDALKKPRSREQ